MDIDPAEIDAVDALPPAPRPRPLTFEHAARYAEQAALNALAAVDTGNEDRAPDIIRKAANELRLADDDESLDGWARRGAADGMICGWTQSTYPACGDGPSGFAYCAAWGVCAMVVQHVKAQWLARKG